GHPAADSDPRAGPAAPRRTGALRVQPALPVCRVPVPDRAATAAPGRARPLASGCVRARPHPGPGGSGTVSGETVKHGRVNGTGPPVLSVTGLRKSFRVPRAAGGGLV